MDDLIARINTEIDQDVRIVHGEDWHAQEERYWPDRVERQAAAFRKILEEHERLVAANSSDRADIAERAALWRVVGLLADVYGIEHP